MRLLSRLRRPADEPPEQRRQRLIDRKHATMGEIRMLQREITSLRRQGRDVRVQESRLRGLQSEHYRLRMEIDRSR